MDYPTIDQCIGNTRMVRLQRMPGNTSNTILAKLEGDNPAGSVKDRPALSMIAKAEERGDITPGDRLIEATSCWEMKDFCIIGSGISGATIAKALSKKFSLDVYDKARGAGGRSSNKKLNKNESFDHGVQYISPKSDEFKKFIKSLIYRTW